MDNRLYVGNLPYNLSDDELGRAFGAYGEVLSASIIIEKETGRSKGFGFVEMGSDDEATAALEGMNGASLGGRTLKVDRARPRQDRGGSGGGGGGMRQRRDDYGSGGYRR